ncbi:MAG: DMT family transporter [Synechococcus sp.]
MTGFDVMELLLLAALWGASFLLMRMAAPVLGPVWLIEMRVLLAGLVLLPMLARWNLLSELRKHVRALLVVGGINSALPFVLYAFASVSLPAGFTSVLNATAPLFGTIVAAIWLRDRVTPVQLVGLGLGFVGVVILVGWQGIAMTPAIGLSVVAGLGAAMMYAIAAPFIKQYLAGVSPLVVTTGSQLSAALLLLPVLPLTVPAQVPPWNIVAYAIALSLFSTAFAYLLYFRLIQRVGSTKALTVTYLIPVFAMVWGAIVLQETVTLAMVLGCGLVLLGTAIANDMLTGGLRSQANR